VIVSQGGSDSATGFFGYHQSFIDPQYFGTTVINYAVIPFQDYGNALYNNAANDGTSQGDAGLVNLAHTFPINSGHAFDLGSVQLFLNGATPPSPNYYFGYNGITFDGMCQTASHEIAEACTDPQVNITNPSDPGVGISNPAWADPRTGNEIADIGIPQADTLITNPVTLETFAVQKLISQNRQTYSGSQFGGENAQIVGPGDFSAGSAATTDSAGDSLVFLRRFDGHIIAKFQPAAMLGTATWFTTDMTNLTNAPLAVSDPSVVNYNDTFHVFYRSPGNHLIDLFDDYQNWYAEDIMQITGFGINSALLNGLPPQYFANFELVSETSPPSAIVYNGTIIVFDVNPYGHVECVFGSPWIGWNWADISTLPGFSQPVAGAVINSDPTTTDTFVSKLGVFTNQFEIEIAYKDIHDHIQLIEFNPWWFGNNGWHWYNLDQTFTVTANGITVFTQNPVMQGDPSVAIYGTGTYIFYRDVNNRIQVIRHSFLDGTWTRRNLGSLANSPFTGTSPTVYLTGNGMHVLYQTADSPFSVPPFGVTGLIGGQMWDDFTADGLNWTGTNLTPILPGNANIPVWGPPLANVIGNTLELFFINPRPSNVYSLGQYGFSLPGVSMDFTVGEFLFTANPNASLFVTRAI
jgi:hypothetical protein